MNNEAQRNKQHDSIKQEEARPILYEEGPYYEYSAKPDASPSQTTSANGQRVQNASSQSSVSAYSRPPSGSTPVPFPLPPSTPQPGPFPASPGQFFTPQPGMPHPAPAFSVAPRRKSRSGLYIILAVSLALVLIAAGLYAISSFVQSSSRTTSTTVTTPAPLQTSKAFRFAPCPFTVGSGLTEGQQVRCGFLSVPENRDKPARKIELAVAIYQPAHAVPDGGPILYLAGGPGGAALDDLGNYITSMNLDSITLGHQFILLDQRGTGHSTPSLDCKELTDLQNQTKDQNIDRDTSNNMYIKAGQTCHDRLVQSGIDVPAYTTIANATDVHDLIRALSLKNVNLYGVSYGTRLALTFMRLFPNDLRSVILDSTLPAQENLYTGFPAVTQHAYDVLFQGCSTSQSCNSKYSNLQDTFYTLVDRLNAQPVTFTDVKYGKILLNGDAFANWLYSALYVTQLIPILPQTITQVDKGDYTVLQRFYGELVLRNDISYGMYYSVTCGEDMALTTKDALDKSADAVRPAIKPNMLASLDSSYGVCQIWSDKTAPAEQHQPVTSSVPTLILSGQYDPITPLSNAKEAAQTLSKSYLVSFPGIGHGVFMTNSCPDSIMQDFLSDPQTQPSTSCVSAMPEPDFQ